MSIAHVQTTLSDIVTGVSTHTKSVTVSAGTNLCGIVAVHMRDAGQNRAVTEVRANGLLLAQGVQRATQISDTTFLRSEIWYMTTTLPVGTYDVVVTYSGTIFESAFSFTVFSGVDQANPIGATSTDTNGTQACSIGITTQRANSWIIDALINTTSASVTVGANQTERENRIGGNGVDVFASSTEATTSLGTYTMSWTPQEAAEWVLAAVEVKESLGVPPPAPQASLVRLWK